MIYAIRAVGTDYIKFGYTDKASAHSRLRELQTGCPFDLSIEASCRGGRALETWVHTRLRKAGLERRNEWFIYGQQAKELVDLMNQDKLGMLERAQSISPTHRRLGAALKYAEQIASKVPQ